MADGEDEIGDERYESLFFSNLLIRCSTNHDKAISTSTQNAWNSYCILYSNRLLFSVSVSLRKNLNRGHMTKTNAIIFFAFVSFLLSACATKIPFERSPVVPGADGKVSMKKDNNGNYSISVSTVNLPSSKNLTPSKEVYVV